MICHCTNVNDMVDLPTQLLPKQDHAVLHYILCDNVCHLFFANPIYAYLSNGHFFTLAFWAFFMVKLQLATSSHYSWPTNLPAVFNFFWINYFYLKETIRRYDQYNHEGIMHQLSDTTDADRRGLSPPPFLFTTWRAHRRPRYGVRAGENMGSSNSRYSNNYSTDESTGSRIYTRFVFYYLSAITLIAWNFSWK